MTQKSYFFLTFNTLRLMMLYGLAFHPDKLRDRSLRITGQVVGDRGPTPRWLQSQPGHLQTSCVALTALFAIERRCSPETLAWCLP
jgi:hypothetical protein